MKIAIISILLSSYSPSSSSISSSFSSFGSGRTTNAGRVGAGISW